MLASSLENPDYSKSINNYRFSTFIYHLFVLVLVIFSLAKLSGVPYVAGPRWRITVLIKLLWTEQNYLFGIKPKPSHG